MPTVISHAVSGLALNSLLPEKEYSTRTALICAFCAAAPDLDAIGFRIGIPYGHWLGHRGFSHSILFAAVLGLAFSLLFRKEDRKTRVALFSAFFLSTASHGLLDAMTNGGLGVAFFSPFSNARYFLPWRPIKVSPISVTGFFTNGGWAVLKSEFLLVIAPSLIVLAGMAIKRRRLKPAATKS